MNESLPCIIIPGMGHSKMELFDEAGQKQKTVWPLRVDEKEAARRIRGPYFRTVLTRRDAMS